MSGKSPAEGDEEDGVDLGLRGDVFVVVVLWGVVFVGVVLVLWEVVVLGLVFVMVVVLFAVLFVLFILLLKLLFRFLRAVVLVLTVAMEAADCGRIVRCNECFMAMSSCVLFDRNDDDGFGTGEEVLLIMVVCECLWTQLSVTPTDAAAVLWFVCVCVCVCVCAADKDLLSGQDDRGVSRCTNKTIQKERGKSAAVRCKDLRCCIMCFCCEFETPRKIHLG